MDAPTGHEQNADQVAYWNGPAGQRWADRQAAQDVLLKPVADLVVDRAELQAGRARHRCRLRQRRHDDRVRAKGRAVGPCARRRYLGPDAGAGAAEPRRRTCRSISCWRMRPSIRSTGKFRRAGLAVRRDVLRRSRAVVCEHAQGAAAVGPAGVRLLARAARKSVLHGAAAGRLQARAKAAAAGAGRSRAVCVRLGGARPPHPRRGRLYRHQMEPCPLLLDAAIGRGLDGAVQGALEIGPVSRALDGQPAELRGRRPIRSAKR